MTEPAPRSPTRAVVTGLLLFGSLTVVHAAEPPAATAAAPRQYTFAWQFVDGDTLAPRGGTTRGVPVTLLTTPAPAWLDLQQPGLADFERDRRAILAMAGEFRASFDFLEVVGYSADYHPPRPYQSWGTEKVYVIADQGNFISLQHVLVMRLVLDDGSSSEPYVTRHWRQDWQYQPSDKFEYRGADTWAVVAVPVAARTGSWRQSVYQVDDSPRYAGVGRWQHFGNYSTWVSDDTWRPLPRREFSVRDDYQVLIGTNRHTITPTGWIHEELNNKVALGADGQPRSDSPVVGREFGFNRYERIAGFDFGAGDRYVASTEPLWRIVREEWTALLEAGQPVRLRGAPDREQLFGPLFDMAAELESTGPAANAEEWEAGVRAAVRHYLP